MPDDDDPHPDILVKTIRRGFNNPEFSDITLKSRSSIFYCHKLILSSRGGNWGQTFNNGNHLDYSSLEDEAVERILKWIYLGQSLLSKRDHEEFVIELLRALKAFDITSAEEECEKFQNEKSYIRNQIKKEVRGKKGPVQKCGFCQGCLRPDCGICRQCVDMVKFGGPGKLKEKCRMRSCSAQIQTRNLRKINKEVPRPVNFVDMDSKNNNEVNAKHAKLKVNANNGVGDVYNKIKGHPMEEEVKADITKQYETRPGLAMDVTNAGITNLHVPSNVIIDAPMPNVIHDGGQMWNKDNKLEEVYVADENNIKDLANVKEASTSTNCAEVKMDAEASVEEAEHELVAMDMTEKMGNDLIIENSFHRQLIRPKGKNNEKIHEKMENEKEKDEIQKIPSEQLSEIIKTDHDYAVSLVTDEVSREVKEPMNCLEGVAAAKDRDLIKADHDYARSAEESTIKADYAKVLGSAVKSILHDGMSNIHSVVF